MADKTFKGKITFVQHEKKFVSIEYTDKGKIKTVNGSIKDAAQQKLIDEGLIKKPHYFREGDEVIFDLVRSVRGDKMTADRIRFRFNNTLNNLLNKAKLENKFTGYLKLVDDQYFIKEIASYHFFPLKFSPWEGTPAAHAFNEPVLFKLENISNPDKATARMLAPLYIPEYKKAQQLAEKKTVIEASVYKTSPHGIYVNIVGDKIHGKLALKNKTDADKIKPGDIIPIIITHVGPDRIAIKRVDS
jgi:hypothetical protein